MRVCSPRPDVLSVRKTHATEQTNCAVTSSQRVLYFPGKDAMQLAASSIRRWMRFVTLVGQSFRWEPENWQSACRSPRLWASPMDESKPNKRRKHLKWWVQALKEHSWYFRNTKSNGFVICSQSWTAAALHKANEIHTPCRITVMRVKAPRTTKATEVLAGTSVRARILKKMYATTEMRLIVSDMNKGTLQQMAKQRHDRFSNFTCIVNICMALERICQRIHKAKSMSEWTIIIMPGSNKKQAAKKRHCGGSTHGPATAVKTYQALREKWWKIYAPNTVIKGLATKSDKAK